ncbi:hypothetical protein ACTFIW_003453 [Dictyostelium discoideum]
MATKKDLENKIKDLESKLNQLKKSYYEISLKKLYDVGIPKSIYWKRTNSTPSKSPYGTHSDCEWEEKEFGILKDIKDVVSTNINQSSELLLRKEHTRGDFEFSSEAECCSLVKLLLQDIILLCGEEVKLTEHPIGLTGIRPDFWVISLLGKPIGFVDVKLPLGIVPEYKTTSTSSSGSIIMNSKKVFGQLFDYLMRLKHYDGVENVFGIFTTFTEFRIVWSIESNELASSKHLHPITSSTTTTNTKRNNKIQPDLKGITNFKNCIDSIIKREMCCSKVYKYNDTDLINVLCSAILKMKYSSSSSNCLNNSRFRVYTLLEKENTIWCNFTKSTPTNFRYVTKLKNQNLESLILLNNLGGGGDGQVFSAVTSNFCLVAVKFYNNLPKYKDLSKQLDSIKRESECWNKVYGLHTIVTKLAKTDCIIMPFLKVANKKDWADKKFKNLVLSACKKFADCGYFHMDLKRCHVTKMKDEHETQVVFIDLYRVEKITNNQKEEKSILMFNILYPESQSPPLSSSSSSSSSSPSSSSSSKKPYASMRTKNPLPNGRVKKRNHYIKYFKSSMIPSRFQIKPKEITTPEKGSKLIKKSTSSSTHRVQSKKKN